MLTGHGFTTSYLVDTKAGSCAISDVESSLSDQSHASSVNEQHSLMRQQEARTSRRGMDAATMRVMKRSTWHTLDQHRYRVPKVVQDDRQQQAAGPQPQPNSYERGKRRKCHRQRVERKLAFGEPKSVRHPEQQARHDRTPAPLGAEEARAARVCLAEGEEQDAAIERLLF